MRFIIFAMFLNGCAPVFARRAAFEMNCPEDDLEFEKLMRETWGVRGCGKQMTYQKIRGDWVRADRPVEHE